MQRNIRWDGEAALSFAKTIKYIKKDSVQNAELVKSDILARISELLLRPEIHPPDKYKTAMKLRAIELLKYTTAASAI